VLSNEPLIDPFSRAEIIAGPKYAPNPARANDGQVGGDHYRKFGKLQPWDVILHFGCDFLTGSAIKYLLRWPHKGQRLQDLEKARHYLDKLIETEKARVDVDPGR
jgi:hypothetical protein